MQNFVWTQFVNSPRPNDTVTHICVSKTYYYCACSVPSHYLNQCCLIEHKKHMSMQFYLEFESFHSRKCTNALQNIVCEMATILSRPQMLMSMAAIIIEGAQGGVSTWGENYTLCFVNYVWWHGKQATGLDAWASRVKCPARFVSHLHDICIYIWVVYSFCLFCCLFIVVTWWYVWCIEWASGNQEEVQACLVTLCLFIISCYSLYKTTV